MSLHALRALLLTDVVGSTQMSETLGDAAMAAVWAAHDRAARDLLVPWRGREIDKTDGLLLMFDTAADAAAYAQAYHRALAALPVPLQARAGLHLGPVLLRDNSALDMARGAKPLELEGPAKALVARVMALAAGAQTLATRDAVAALAHALAPALALANTLTDAQGSKACSHGHWVMKGSSDPLELFEIGPDDTCFEAPRCGDRAWRVVRRAGGWLPVTQIANNLPQQPTAFIGRERELRELKGRLAAGERLITLLGMGGLGKTRLSLQVAAQTLHAYPDGVFFIDLTAIRDPGLVASEAARALDITDEPGRPLLDTLCAQLRQRQTLLVFDGCEHLSTAVAELLGTLLKACAGLKVLASSRTLLGVPGAPGEHSYTVQPLPLPQRGDGVAALLQSTAARLFVSRVLAQRPDYELVAENAAGVADLVVRLEGIPLAIELAAARMRTMDLADINEGLRQRFDLLQGGSRRLPARQQTLRGLVDWSYDMLGTMEQRVFARLGLFAGGFALDAAQSVCAGDAVPADAVPAALESLVEKSLAMHERTPQGPRWRMLETLREYAHDRLAASGDAPAAATRHCEHFFMLSKLARDGLQGPQQRAWLDRLELERDNVRAAIALPQTSASGVDPFVAVKMAVALQNFWIMRGGAAEGREVVLAMRQHPAVAASPMAQAHAMYVGAALAWAQGDLDEALGLLRACLALRRGLNASKDIAATLSMLAVTLLSSGDTASARACGAEAVVLFRDCGYRVGEAIAMLQMGQVEAASGNTASAGDYLQHALSIAVDIQHAETEGEAQLLLGDLAAAAGDTADAARLYAASLALCAGAGDLRGEASAQGAQGRLDLQAGRLADASERLHNALLAFERLDMRAAWVACLEDHALLAQGAGAAATACALAAFAQHARERAHIVRTPGQQTRWQLLLADIKSALDIAAFDAAWAQAQAWDPAEATRQALASHPRVRAMSVA